MTSHGARRIVLQVEEGWRPFRNLAGHLLSRLEEKTPAGWTAKEMLGTIAFWDEAAFGWITTGLRHRDLPEGWTFGSGYLPGDSWPRADEHNAREARWAAATTAADVMDRCDQAHDQLLAILATVTDEEAEANRDYFRRLGGHYLGHLPELQALADRVKA